MSIKNHLVIRSSVLKGHVNKYAILGLCISILSILFASLLVSYQLTGSISIEGIVRAQTSNPAIWALNLTPFMFAYWGQSFCYELASQAELIIEDKTKELVSKSGDLESKLRYETNHDSLTNLPNSRLFSERINQGIKQVNQGEELAVILLNIRGFKKINYTYGSFGANSLLMQFSEKLKTILLEPYMLQAYMGMNMIARLQGAEFGILLPRLREEHNLEAMLAKIVDDTTMNLMIDGNSISIAITAGAALYPQHGNNDDDLTHHATLSLLHAETVGKSYELYNDSMDKNYKTKRTMLKEIGHAIENEEVDILYRPVVELNTGKILGAEAVVSLNNANYGTLNAEQLIPLVEGKVLVNNLTVSILKKAFNQLVLWHQSGHKIYLSVDLLNATDKDLPALIGTMLTNNNLSAEYLKVDLTEKACLVDQTRSIIFLNELSALGVKIEISDFCSGYASFVYLTNFPIDVIKVDKSFVMNMMKDEKKLKIVRSIIKLAEAMDLVVAADGITDVTILDALKKLGYLYGQGDYFSAPVSADDFTKILTKS